MQRYFLLACACVCSRAPVFAEHEKEIERAKRVETAGQTRGSFFILAERRAKQNVVKERERKRGWEAGRRKEPEE